MQYFMLAKAIAFTLTGRICNLITFIFFANKKNENYSFKFLQVQAFGDKPGLLSDTLELKQGKITVVFFPFSSFC